MIVVEGVVRNGQLLSDADIWAAWALLSGVLEAPWVFEGSS